MIPCVVRAFPVFVACEGCPEFGQAARDAALLLDRRGRGELAWLGDAGRLATTRAKSRSRFPIFSVDACAKACARRWLAQEGTSPQRSFVLSESELEDIDAAARRIAAQI